MNKPMLTKRTIVIVRGSGNEHLLLEKDLVRRNSRTERVFTVNTVEDALELAASITVHHFILAAHFFVDRWKTDIKKLRACSPTAQVIMGYKRCGSADATIRRHIAKSGSNGWINLAHEDFGIGVRGLLNDWCKDSVTTDNDAPLFKTKPTKRLFN